VGDLNLIPKKERWDSSLLCDAQTGSGDILVSCPIQWILGVILWGQNGWNVKLTTVKCDWKMNSEEAGLGTEVRLECWDLFEDISPLLVRRDRENHEMYQDVCWLRFFCKGDIQFNYCLTWVNTFLDSYRRTSEFHLEIRDNHLLPDPYTNMSNIPIHLPVCSPNSTVEIASKQ
jgi:hypothetical protein